MTLTSLFAVLLLSSQQPATFVITSARVFDGTRFIGERHIVVQDGIIAAVLPGGSQPPNALRRVDGRGRTVMPGLIDGHVHLSEQIERDLAQAAALGVTTMLDLWSGPSRLPRLKALEASAPPGLADVRTAGIGATAPGGHPTQMGGPPTPTLTDPAEADSFVADRVAEGADFLKIIYDDVAWIGRRLPMISRATLEALIAAGHRRGKVVIVHVGTEAQAADAVAAGADGLAHWFIGRVDPALVRAMAARGTFVIGTLSMLEGVFCGKPAGPSILADSLLAGYLDPASRQGLTLALPSRAPMAGCSETDAALRSLVQAGVPLVTGTDAPVPGAVYGASVHVESARLVAAGIAPADALAAATSRAAAAFRLSDRGSIRPGLRADLILIDGDPSVDVVATRRIVGVWKRGVAVGRTPAAQ